MTAKVLQIRDYQSKRTAQAIERAHKRSAGDAVKIMDRVHYHDTAPSEYVAPPQDIA